MNRQKLSAEMLKKHLKATGDIKIFKELESTNTTAKQDAEKGAPEGSVIIALSQTGGKGRLGRSFYSPDGSGIYFSLILKPKFAPEDITFITPLAAVAVCYAIESLTTKKPQIKWVNDIFINNKKVCGILSEGAFAPDGKALKYIILGIGINLYAPKNGFPEEIKTIAGSVLESNEVVDINLLLAGIINNFFELYKNLKSTDTVEAYRNRLLLKNQKVNYLKNGEENVGTVLDIDEAFRLVIKTESGEREHLQSGEVTVGSKEVAKK